MDSFDENYYIKIVENLNDIEEASIIKAEVFSKVGFHEPLKTPLDLDILYERYLYHFFLKHGVIFGAYHRASDKIIGSVSGIDMSIPIPDPTTFEINPL